MIPAQHLHGLLLGTAIGDAIGLPAEGLKPATIAKRGWDQNWEHRFVFGRGMWSDDTEHTLILAQALNHSGGNPERFQKLLARGLRHWLLFLPAGVGLATARSIFKLWLGFSPERSGVYSAGNGPMMRAALLGVVFRDSPEKRTLFNRIHSRLTHTDPKAEYCSRAIVELAALFTQPEPDLSLDSIFATLAFEDADSNFRALLESIRIHLDDLGSLPDLLTALDAKCAEGVSGYCYHTLAAVLHCGIAHDWHPTKALPAIWSAGGDTDTTGAILGALCGTLHGPSSFPKAWSERLCEFPVTLENFERLADSTVNHSPLTIRCPFHPVLLLRNSLFLLIVLGHGFARLGPQGRKLRP